jgi:hypothetical protein
MNALARIAFAVLFASTAAAQQTPQPPPPLPNCNDPVHRQFDFWIGTWKVTRPDGKPAGRNTIRSRFGGCVLEEQWEGARMTGGSFNAYDRQTGKWRQSWVDSTGTVLLLDGGLVDGAMVLTGRQGDAQQRITWRRMDGGRVRQTWEQSTDGKEWTVAFDGIYTKE